MHSWSSKYKELTDYVGAHPAIEITPNIMLIPDAERPEFYRLFNLVLVQFVKDLHPIVLAEGLLLSASFAETKEKIISFLNLKSVEIKAEVGWFLEDAVGGLARKLYDPLFSLLQGKIDLASFEQQGAEVTVTLARSLLHRGYLQWTTMSIVHMLQPDGLYSVPVDDESIDSDLTTADKRPGWWTVDVPDIIPADVLRLDASQYTSFLAPQAILHLRRLNVFAGVRTDFYTTYHRARELSKRFEWLSREAIIKDFGMGDLWPDMAVYMGGSAKDLRVVADYASLARPDVIVDVMEKADWYLNGGLESVKRHSHILKPRLGGFVVCRHSVPHATIEALAPEVTPLVAAYDASRIAPLIDAVVGYASVNRWPSCEDED
jgi:hypothetical protein